MRQPALVADDLRVQLQIPMHMKPPLRIIIKARPP
jgi:hypothetical protein